MSHLDESLHSLPPYDNQRNTSTGFVGTSVEGGSSTIPVCKVLPSRADDNNIAPNMGIYTDSNGLSQYNSELSSGMDTSVSGMHKSTESPSQGSKRAYVTIAILFFINLINYMDRLTIAGVLTSVKSYYSLSNTQAGLLQTAFVVSYMIMAPIFGYLGDRYNRKAIIVFGVLFWSATTLAGSFIPAEYYPLFLLLRALVGTGEASYSTVAPTIIADLFSHSLRTKMVAVFYFAIPVGSGLGYIVGSSVSKLLGNWFWALRITPVLGVVAVILTVFVVHEPPRGESDGGTSLKNTGIKDDCLHLLRNRSFMWSTVGFTCVTFATGCLAWWAPTYMSYALQTLGSSGADEDSVGLKFGVITCVAGFVGIVLGSAGAQYYRKYNERADPIICASGVLLSVPLLFIGCIVADRHENLSWTLIFFGEVLLCVNWAIVADMLLYVVIPTRRSIAGAAQILISHMLGDAFSPYLIGAVSDAYIARHPNTVTTKYLGLQYSLYICSFVLVLGSLSFFVASFYIVEDKEKCKKETIGGEQDSLFGHRLPNPIESSIDEFAWSFSDTQPLVS